MISSSQKVKYLTNHEKELKIMDEVDSFIAKLEKRYKCTILFNTEEVIFNK